MNFTTKTWPLGFAGMVLVGACARGPAAAPVPVPVLTPVIVTKAPLPPVNPRLPAVPDVRGPLQIKVQYPPAGSTIEAKDSNFVFGQIGNGEAALLVNGVASPVWPNGSFMAWLPVPPPVTSTDSTGKANSLARYDLLAIAGNDTSRLTHVVRVANPPVAGATPDTVVPVAAPTYASAGSPRPPTPLRGTQSAKCFGAIAYCDLATPLLSDTDRVVIGRPAPTGTYKWFLIPGTSVRVTGTQSDFSRIQLDSDQTIWIANQDLSPAQTAPAPIALGTSQIAPAKDWVDIVIPISAPPAFIVEESDRRVSLTFYGVGLPASALKSVVPSNPDAYVGGLQISGNEQRTVFSVDLKGPAYGYLSWYRNGQFTLRLRRPPEVNAASPLKGLTIAVDAGHPPIGATGPTGLWEPVATLAVGFKVRDLLLARGASVVMTRTTDEHVDVDLAVRPTVARKNNAHAFVSIHLNALPDGVNPFTHHGTNSYWFYPHSTKLAESIQRNLVGEMGLADKGVHWANFAVMRGTWMPSSLAEGAFIMMPDQEAAMRTSEYQEQYARGIVQGLEDFFRTFAQK